MIIENQEFVTKVYARLLLFQRYRDTLTINKENIAAHSYFVSLIGNLICKKLKVPNDIRLKVLEMGLYHDISESISDDFSFEMKYNPGNEDFREGVEAIEARITDEISSNMDDDIWDLVKEYKIRETLASKIVKLADKYSVLFYCKIESKVSNEAIKVIEERVTLAIDDMEKEILELINNG